MCNYFCIKEEMEGRYFSGGSSVIVQGWLVWLLVLPFSEIRSIGCPYFISMRGKEGLEKYWDFLSI